MKDSGPNDPGDVEPDSPAGPLFHSKNNPPVRFRPDRGIFNCVALVSRVNKKVKVKKHLHDLVNGTQSFGNAL